MIDKFLDQNLNEVQLIIFQLGNEEYAVPIVSVQEIIMMQQSTRIPKSPTFVEGVINLRGHIIPIIDGGKKFQLLSSSQADIKEKRIMVIEVEEEKIGLIVDAVSEVIHLKSSEIEPPPIDMGCESDFLWGVGKYDNRLLILLNPEKFLNINESHDVRKLGQVSEILKQSKELSEVLKK